MSQQKINLGIIVLAAGASIRMGTPKQLLPWNEQTLLQKTLNEIQDISLPIIQHTNIVVVVGAELESIVQSIKNPAIQTVHNTEWESGMASSIRCGVKFITATTQPDFILICLCDQPFVTSHHYNNLIVQCINTEKGIAASLYSKSVGVPALFGKEYIKELRTLQGDRGARQLIVENISDTLLAECPQAAIDIDTTEDYLNACKLLP